MFEILNYYRDKASHCRVNLGSELKKILLKKPQNLVQQVLTDKRDSVPLTWGHLLIQMQGKRKEREEYFCVLQGSTLFFQTETGLLRKSQLYEAEAKSDKIQTMVLTGALVKMVDEGELKGIKFAMKLIHTSRCLLYKMDYVYLITADAKSLQRWYYALRTVCMPYEHVYTNPSLATNNNAVKHFQSTMRDFEMHRKFDINESGEFLNVFLNRTFIHFSESNEIREALAKKLAMKMAIVIDKQFDDKHLKEKLNDKIDIAVTEVSVGSKPPKLSNFNVCNNNTGKMRDTIIEFDLSYHDGDATCIVESKVDLAVASVGLKAKMTTRKWEGRMKFVIPPYPVSRMSVSFASPPEVQVDIDIEIQTQKSYSLLPSQIKRLLESKFKEIINDTFVEPNAEWILLPGVMENDPPAPKTSMHITLPGEEKPSSEDLESQSTSPPGSPSKFVETNPLSVATMAGAIVGNISSTKKDSKKEKKKKDKVNLLPKIHDKEDTDSELKSLLLKDKEKEKEKDKKSKKKEKTKTSLVVGKKVNKRKALQSIDDSDIIYKSSIAKSLGGRNDEKTFSPL
eukprot:TRINITY_DN1707_c0_g1_i1.p1 TRINITY_DN1707_c0_g1~~TRINITY_DN1707_c0_g1_i1.p1  ORF type:complete len:567 (-),score=91.51 TRINITY_DN1707_c0_g1_i1:35-1735(-)